MERNNIKTIRGIDLGKCTNENHNNDNTVNIADMYVDSNGRERPIHRINVFDSELLRIIETVDAANVDRTGEHDYLPGIISVKVDVPKLNKKWQSIIAAEGIIRVIHGIVRHDDKEFHLTGEEEEFKRLIVGSGHVRAQKALFVRLDIWDKVNEILLCGLDRIWAGYPMYEKGAAKWNAYYGLASTDSIAVGFPNIVVIPDLKCRVTDRFDFVKIDVTEDPKWKLGDPPKNRYEYHYSVEPDTERTKESIMPFDGAGLVSVECASRWARQLDCEYIPAAFQFRAIPGFKGNLYTYDIKAWGAEHGWVITDIKGKAHDTRNEIIDAIMTDSQTKFLNLYDNDIEVWRQEFQKSVAGYERTFNISEYSESKLKSRAFSSYQHLQTIKFTPDEIETFIQPTVDWLTKISTSFDNFLKYRNIHDAGDDNGDKEEWERVPPYYKVAKMLDTEDREILFNDPFINKKVINELKSAKHRALAGKESIHGNYQYFTPDLYGLAQFAFMTAAERAEIKNDIGLLKPFEVYSQWWNCQNVEKVAIVRNPHIAMEARIVKVVSPGEKMKRWYKYQETGIVVDSFSTLALALGTADFDGDHVLTTDSPEYVRAVERALAAGDGRTVDYEMDSHSEPVDVSKTSVLMQADWDGYCNNIGTVVNKVTKLWSSVGIGHDHDTVMKYIAITDIIGQMTIDAAKKGGAVPGDDVIRDYLTEKKAQYPYFFRYLKQHETRWRKESREIRKKRQIYGKETDTSTMIKFTDADTNMNQICHAVEEQLEKIRTESRKKTFDWEWFIGRFCTANVNDHSDLYKRVKAALKPLIDQHRQIIKQIRDSGSDVGIYDCFYQYARNILLSEGKYKKNEKIVNIMICLAYVDPEMATGDLAKSILWNSFDAEMEERAISKEHHKIDLEQFRKTKNTQKKKQSSRKADDIDGKSNREIHFPRELKTVISGVIRADKTIDNKKLDKQYAADLRRMMVVLLVLEKRTIYRKESKLSGTTKDAVKQFDLPSSSELARLAGMDNKRNKVGEMLRDLEKLGLIEFGKDLKVKVQYALDYAECENVLDDKLKWSKDDREICAAVIKAFRWKNAK